MRYCDGNPPTVINLGTAWTEINFELIDNTIEVAPSLTLILIAGGLHLVVAPDPIIEKLASSLKNDWKIDWITPGHCNGEPSFAARKQACGDHYLYAVLGAVIELGAMTRNIAARDATRTLIAKR